VTTDESVALDALRAIGLGHITSWHLRCLDAWAAQVAETGWAPPYSATVLRSECVETRLKSDLRASGVDVLHIEAQWEDARRTVYSRNASGTDRSAPTSALPFLEPLP